MNSTSQETSTSQPTALNGSHPGKPRKARQPAAASSPKQAARAYANSEAFADSFETELVIIRGELEKQLDDTTSEVKRKIAALATRGVLKAVDRSLEAWAADAPGPAKPAGKKRGPKAKKVAAKTAAKKSSSVKAAKVKAPRKPRAKKAASAPLLGGAVIGGEAAKVLAAIQATGAEGILTQHLGNKLGFKPGPVAKGLIAAGKITAKGKNRGTRYFAV